jgi:hypothetical protein
MAKKDAAPKQKTSKPKAPRKPKSADVGTPVGAAGIGGMTLEAPADPNTAPASGDFAARAPVLSVDAQLLELGELIAHLRDAPHSAVRSVVNDAEIRIDAIRSSLP